MRNGNWKRVVCNDCKQLKVINRKWLKRLEIRYNMICYKTNKRIFDKKGAITFKNLTLKLHKIKMKEYPCGDHWHLATVEENGHHRRFRHNL